MTVPNPDVHHNRLPVLMVTIALANFMCALDASIVTVALPTISKIFNVLPGTGSLVITVYILVMAGCVLIFGKLSDAIGFKTMFLSGFFIFTVASFFCGFLPVVMDSFTVFIVARIIQAIGATMIIAIGPGMVAAYIPIEMRGKAMGTIFTMAALGMAVGPIAGGLLVQLLSWSWIFFINIPIGIITILLGKKIIPDLPAKMWKPGFDWAGSVLIFICLSSLLFALSQGQVMGWSDPVIIRSFLLALVTLSGFVWREFTAPDPMLEIRLFKGKNFLLTSILLMAVNFALVGVMFLVPFYLQYVKEHTPSVVGLIFTSFSFGIMAGGILGGTLYQRYGGRAINIGFWAPMVAGYAMLAAVQAGMSDWYMVLSLLLIGTGSGTIMTSGSNMIINAVAKKYQGMISSLISLLRFLPMAMGVAIFNIVFMAGIPSDALQGGKTETLAGISIADLSSGFHLAFIMALGTGIIILLFAYSAHQEIHADYTS
jgi:EmrB/QacA subfamily drug resistance transporter